MIDIINAMPDVIRFAIYPIILILGQLFGWQVFEDGSILP